ncbi:MAG TPA: SIMPL domain-containing protein, partial [Propylenella sp.]|nr:SIMPL domain-containing protein [Propylenella sp.]
MQIALRAMLIALALAGPLGAGIAEAQNVAADSGERRLTVIGEGLVHGRPDMALIIMGVVSEAPSASEALSANSAAMTRILDALKADGLESRDLQTSNFSVEPRYSQPPPGYDGSQPFEPKIVGYAVRNELTIRIRDLTKVGALLDQVIGLGANTISGPTFTVAEPRSLEDEARRAAMADALRKGNLYAEAAGLPLGPIARIEETMTQWPPPMPLGAMAREMAADASVPIEGGELGFRAQVTVSW